ncbi:MAG TPA: TorF family putative porin [Gammaproteobacteria bacterium]|nr:TorF family putative porin [Gammaproteobacteria bacterium]
MMKRTLVPALVLAVGAATPAISMAGVTGNIGYVSDYVFRGIYQTDSSAFAGVDYASDSGFYAGTWWADVGAGTETDLYFGYNGGSDSVKYKIGYTGYRYLDDFDGDYDEINLGLYAGIFALDIAVGQYDGDKFHLGDPVSGGNQDYVFTSVTLSPKKGPYYKLGMWSGDYNDHILPNIKTDDPRTAAIEDGDGIYLELGYAYTMEEQGVVLSVALDYSPDLTVSPFLNASAEAPNYELTFGIKKNFEPKK